MPAVVLLTHSADADLVAVSRVLTSIGVPNLLWFLDARDDQLAVDAAPGFFQLRRGTDVLSNEALEQASTIVFRTRLGPRDHLVASTREAPAERAFAQREWSSLLGGLLLEAEERHEHAAWINRPSTDLLASTKYQLIATAALDGLVVPRFRVSTEGLLPPSVNRQFVCKAINEDESIDDDRTFPTTVLEDELVSRSPFQTDCPSFIQERVDTQWELRVYHLLGEVLGVRIGADPPSHVDIRFAAKASLQIDQASVPSELAEAVRRYCARRRFSYCVFDFLYSRDGVHYLVDVTPSGAWAYLEAPGDPFITRWYVDTLCRLCLKETGTQTAPPESHVANRGPRAV